MESVVWCSALARAGAAAIVRGWFSSIGVGPEPGKIYSTLIAFGTQQDPYPNNKGAGRFIVGRNSFATWQISTRDVGHGQFVDIPLLVAGFLGYSPRNLRVGVWWQDPSASHNNIDLFVLMPNGTQALSGASVGSIFERGHIDGTLSSGTWKIRLIGTSVPVAPQRVCVCRPMMIAKIGAS
jgi:hypothetical protein